MERRERPVKPSESADLYTLVDLPFDTWEVLTNCGERAVLICESDGFLVSLPGGFSLLEGRVVKEALLGQYLIKSDVPCSGTRGCGTCVSVSDARLRRYRLLCQWPSFVTIEINDLPSLDRS